METILQVSHLSLSFSQYSRGTQKQNLPVIHDLSFSIQPGQVVAVVGSSGSGKSLLAHGILGILPYNSAMEGTILYRGEPLTQNGRRPSGAGRSSWSPRGSPTWTP